MIILSILIPITIIIGFVLTFLLKSRTVINNQLSYFEATLGIAISWDDLIRQILLSFVSALILAGLYGVSHSLRLPIGWYWIMTFGGIITAYIAYYQHSPLTFAEGILQWVIGILGGSYQVAMQNGVNTHIVFISGFCIFASLYILGLSLFSKTRSRRYYTILSFIGVMGLGILSFILGSFGVRGVWEVGLSTSIENNSKTLAIVIGSFGLLGVSCMVGLKYLKTQWYQWISVGIGLLGAILMVFLPQVSQLYDPNNSFATNIDIVNRNLEILPHIIAFNSIFLIGVLWLLYSSYRLKEVWRVDLGVVVLFGFTIIRYFDWIERTELDRSLFFLGLGIVFLGTGWILERIRRNVLSSIDT
jgi:hypothetical protein